MAEIITPKIGLIQIETPTLFMPETEISTPTDLIQTIIIICIITTATTDIDYLFEKSAY